MSVVSTNLLGSLPKDLLDKFYAAKTEAVTWENSTTSERDHGVVSGGNGLSVGLTNSGSGIIFESVRASGVQMESIFVSEEQPSSPVSPVNALQEDALPSSASVGKQYCSPEPSRSEPQGSRLMAPSFQLSSEELHKVQLQQLTPKSDTTNAIVPIEYDTEDTQRVLTLSRESKVKGEHAEVVNEIIAKNEGEEFFDISPYLLLPQHEASVRLGIPSSSLSKRWKDATVNRNWPYRAIQKLDKQIAMLMHNLPKDGAPDPNTEKQLAELMLQRQNETRPVLVRR